jgi:cGMP-dependent protein kinase 2
VVMYVLLTGRQPFSTPKTDDPMVVMRRIVDENYVVKYPPYVSSAAKVRLKEEGGREAMRELFEMQVAPSSVFCLYYTFIVLTL